MKSKVYVKAAEFVGHPKLTDFKIIEQEVSEDLQDGEILTEAVCISPDPYTRVWKIDVGQEFIGFQLARILKSKNAEYPEGSLVLQQTGWRTITKSKGEQAWYTCDDLPKNIPQSSAVGVLGMPGVTAHYGLLTFCEPKKGETVMVTGAAGAVGTIVGQIAKILGCRVIGCCGSDEKVEYVKSIGFDAAFNYKTSDWDKALTEAAPDGIDCYFDNVGGKMSSTVMNKMNPNGRVAVCGCISSYNSTEPDMAPVIQLNVVVKCLRITGLLVFNNSDKKGSYNDLKKWLEEGRIQTRETVSKGFENIPQAFMNMLKGGNIGKAVVVL
ncbi:prostaglandin reductase 1-like [Clavelina lepadiformis]|uniref:prostaglandin reductase 1-like n=1 Tax=Clavelina lepadiformis TaxID=159417 RepID=UPI004042A693